MASYLLYEDEVFLQISVGEGDVSKIQLSYFFKRSCY